MRHERERFPVFGEWNGENTFIHGLVPDRVGRDCLEEVLD
jgi:hypothetical protein